MLVADYVNNKLNAEYTVTGKQELFTVHSSHSQGWWYEVEEENNDRFLSTLSPSPLPEKTDLKGFFCRELEVKGVDPNGDTIFLMGKEENLFGCKYYYEPVLILDENRVFKMYSRTAGRDFFFVNGKWK